MRDKEINQEWLLFYSSPEQLWNTGLKLFIWNAWVQIKLLKLLKLLNWKIILIIWNIKIQISHTLYNLYSCQENIDKIYLSYNCYLNNRNRNFTRQKYTENYQLSYGMLCLWSKIFNIN